MRRGGALPALGWLGEADGRCLAACAAAGLALVTIAALLPALPVDETRYLTVAWEMHQSGNWLLPTLDGEPYSHKPPLLFWLINLAWGVFGEHVRAARLVSVLTAAGLVFLTFRLGRELVGARARLASVLLIATPAMLVYSPLIMFDLLLGVAVLLGLIALWRLAEQVSAANVLLLGAALGLGVLAKGPVVLVHLLPPALLIRFWRPNGDAAGRRWALAIAAALAIGTAIGLAWAIPAAIRGGPAFSEMLLWKQSVGRMVSSFAHKRPFWFFVPVLAAFLAPLFLWRPFWRAVRRIDLKRLTSAQAFLLCWIVPAFVVFSAMSGKQPHYLLPLVPGITLLLASVLDETEASQPGDMRGIVWLFAALCATMLILPPALLLLARDTPTHFLANGIGTFHPLISIAAFLIGAAVLATTPRTVIGQASALAIVGSVLMTTLVVQCHRGLFRFYDLTPIARAVGPFEDQPIAAAMHYAGEVSFLTHLKRPVIQITRDDLDAWLAAHPGAVALLRHKRPLTTGYEVVFTQPYRRRDYFSIIRAKPAPAP